MYYNILSIFNGKHKEKCTKKKLSEMLFNLAFLHFFKNNSTIYTIYEF